jgi:hypothetical protein
MHNLQLFAVQSGLEERPAVSLARFIVEGLGIIVRLGNIWAMRSEIKRKPKAWELIPGEILRQILG